LFATPKSHPSTTSYLNNEYAERPASNFYILSGIVVPPGGWDINAMTVYFEKAKKPAGWMRLARARLNWFRKSADLPLPADDPRKGRVVDVKVKLEKEGVYAVRAEGLGLPLESGEYWIGLTPIVTFEVNGSALHLRTQGHRGEGIEPAVRCPEGEGGPSDSLKVWTTLHDGYLAPFDEEIALRIEGRRRDRGEQIGTSPEGTERQRKVLRLRLAEFDPLERKPTIPPDLMASDQTRIFIIQLESTPDQRSRDKLTGAGLTLLRYLPDDAYIVEMDPRNGKGVAGLPCVRWIGPYHPAYRIDPSLGSGKGGTAGRAAIGSECKECCIQVFKRGLSQKEEAAARIKRAGGLVQTVTSGGYRIVAELTPDQVRAVAQLDEVVSLELMDEESSSAHRRSSAPWNLVSNPSRWPTSARWAGPISSSPPGDIGAREFTARSSMATSGPITSTSLPVRFSSPAPGKNIRPSTAQP